MFHNYENKVLQKSLNGMDFLAFLNYKFNFKFIQNFKINQFTRLYDKYDAVVWLK